MNEEVQYLIKKERCEKSLHTNSNRHGSSAFEFVVSACMHSSPRAAWYACVLLCLKSGLCGCIVSMELLMCVYLYVCLRVRVCVCPYDVYVCA